jgi:hypothetical protein
MSADSDFFEHRHRDRDRPRPHSNGPSRSVVALRAAEDLLDALADRVAERLVVRLEGLTPAPFEELVDAREIARVTGRSRGWVYEHASELGAVRLGAGPRPRLAFSPTRVAAHVQAASEPRTPTPLPIHPQPRQRRRAGRTSTSVELLPIHGRTEI